MPPFPSEDASQPTIQTTTTFFPTMIQAAELCIQETTDITLNSLHTTAQVQTETIAAEDAVQVVESEDMEKDQFKFQSFRALLFQVVLSQAEKEAAAEEVVMVAMVAMVAPSLSQAEKEAAAEEAAEAVMAVMVAPSLFQAEMEAAAEEVVMVAKVVTVAPSLSQEVLSQVTMEAAAEEAAEVAMADQSLFQEATVTAAAEEAANVFLSSRMVLIQALPTKATGTTMATLDKTPMVRTAATVPIRLSSNQAFNV